MKQGKHYDISAMDVRYGSFGRVYLSDHGRPSGDYLFVIDDREPDGFAVKPSNNTPEDASPITKYRVEEYLRKNIRK